jgi:integrase
LSGLKPCASHRLCDGCSRSGWGGLGFHSVIDLTPALRDELAVWLHESSFKRPTDLVFPTTTGKPDNRNNVRKWLLFKAIEKANERLAELGIEPTGTVAPHGLRRTYASLRHT